MLNQGFRLTPDVSRLAVRMGRRRETRIRKSGDPAVGVFTCPFEHKGGGSCSIHPGDIIFCGFWER